MSRFQSPHSRLFTALCSAFIAMMPSLGNAESAPVEPVLLPPDAVQADNAPEIPPPPTTEPHTQHPSSDTSMPSDSPDAEPSPDPITLKLPQPNPNQKFNRQIDLLSPENELAEKAESAKPTEPEADETDPYVLPIDRLPAKEFREYKFKNRRGVPVRVAHDGHVAEVRAHPAGYWHIIIRHPDRTLGVYRPLDCDNPPDVGTELKAGSTLCRTTHRPFFFTRSEPVLLPTSDDTKLQPLPVYWIRYTDTSQPSKHNTDPVEHSGTQATVATGEVSTAGEEGSAPPPPAERVASATKAAEKAAVTESSSLAQEQNWGAIIAMIGGFVGFLGALGGYNWYTTRRENQKKLAHKAQVVDSET